jgi:hypothetical protein
MFMRWYRTYSVNNDPASSFPSLMPVTVFVSTDGLPTVVTPQPEDARQMHCAIGLPTNVCVHIDGLRSA